MDTILNKFFIDLCLANAPPAEIISQVTNNSASNDRSACSGNLRSSPSSKLRPDRSTTLSSLNDHPAHSSSSSSNVNLFGTHSIFGPVSIHQQAHLDFSLTMRYSLSMAQEIQSDNRIRSESDETS